MDLQQVDRQNIWPNSNESLKEILSTKLILLRDEERTQQVIIVCWLFEMLLYEMCQLRNENRKYTDEYAALQDEFSHLLDDSKIKHCLKLCSHAIYQLLDEYGDEENFTQFASKMGDVTKILDHHLMTGKVIPALKLLEKHAKSDFHLYNYSPYLMGELPLETLALISSRKYHLSPSRLVATLIQRKIGSELTVDQQTAEIIRCVEMLCSVCKDTDEEISILQVYLLTLCARVQPDKFGAKVEQLTGTESRFSAENPKLILRQALDISLKLAETSKVGKLAAVQIYTAMSLYEEGFNLALEMGEMQLAKRVANASAEQSDDTDTPRKLWLKIAQRVLSEKKSVKHGIQFLQECSLLKIQDLLQFFPHLTTMQHFGEAVCASLSQSNAQILALKDDMRDATESSKSIREEMTQFRSRYTLIESNESKCSSCSYPLIKRGLYLFPCGHNFHEDCLLAQVMPYLTIEQQTDVQETSVALRDEKDESERQSLQERIDSIIASECVFCGTVMINIIDQPFPSSS